MQLPDVGRFAILLLVPMGLCTLLPAGSEACNYRIYPDAQKQTIAFEMDALPGQVFKIVIPEIITDSERTLLGWNEAPSKWDIGSHRAAWTREISGVIRMNATVLFGPHVIEAEVETTNLSDRTWNLTTAFTCFAFYAAPLFDNPELDRIYLPIDEEWRSVADIFARKSPGTGPYTFFSVKDGPRLEAMQVVRRVGQTHPQIIRYGAAAVTSRDGQWVAGVYARRAAYVFCNRRERCIHANPLYDPIRPHRTASTSTYVLIMRGELADFEKAVLTALR